MQRTFLLLALGSLMGPLLACTVEEEAPMVAAPRKAARATATPGTGVQGGIATSSLVASGSPAATASATPGPATASHAPGAAVRIAVRGVSFAPRTSWLAPAPRPGALGLGLPTSVQLAGHAELGDGSLGPLRWVDRSGGMLRVRADGLVTAAASASAGTYRVRVEALDDPQVYDEALIEIRPRGELAVILE